MNNGAPKHFYVEPEPDRKKTNYPYNTQTPSVHRLRHKTGQFNIEIPVDSQNLREGWNNIFIQIEDEERKVYELNARFSWDPRPIPLPLVLEDLKGFRSIQEVGQVVNGEFDIDPDNNVIRSHVPVGSDILLLLGSPYGSQEATYQVKFSQLSDTWAFIGLSDFFFEHVEQSPRLGIKPGYSTAGLATIDHQGQAKVWLAWGDCLMDKKDTWLVKTEKNGNFPVQAGIQYNVKHQSIIEEGINLSRFRLWPEGIPEPDVWLCEENNCHIESSLQRIPAASFGLFQYWGTPTEWTNINVKQLEIDVSNLIVKKRNEIFSKPWGKVRSTATRIFR